MGQSTSTQQIQTAGHGNGALTNAQISDNIAKLFQSENMSRHNSVQINRSSKAMSTSAVEVDTIINKMKGGNNSRVAIVPKRQRYTNVPKTKSTHVGGVKKNNHFDSDDLKYVRNMVYRQNNMRGGEDNPLEPAPIFSQPSQSDIPPNAFSDTSPIAPSDTVPLPDDATPETDVNAFSDTSPIAPSEIVPLSDDATRALESVTSNTDVNAFSDTSPIAPSEPDVNAFSDTSPIAPSEPDANAFSDTSPIANAEDGNVVIENNTSDLPVKTSPVKTSPVKTSPVKTSPVKTSPDKTSPDKVSPVKTSPVKTSPDKTSPDKTSPDKVSPVKTSPVKTSPDKVSSVKTSPDKETNNALVLGNDYLPSGTQGNLAGGSKNSIDKEIRLIRKMINNTVKQRGGNGTNNNQDTDLLSEDGLADIRAGLAKHGVISQQNGGNFDADLKSFRDNILSNPAEVFSATSPDPSNHITALRGGKSKVKKDQRGGDDDKDEEEEDDEDEDDDDEGDEDEDDEGDEDEDEKEEGTLNTSSQDGGNNLDDSSSSSSSSESNSSSSSESDVSDGQITIMHQSINRAMDKKKNTSKYLKDNNYTITSNSDNDYKINNKLIYSSQTSDVHNSVGSEYLSNMRNRDRLS